MTQKNQSSDLSSHRGSQFGQWYIFVGDTVNAVFSGVSEIAAFLLVSL